MISECKLQGNGSGVSHQLFELLIANNKNIESNQGQRPGRICFPKKGK